MGGPWWGTSGHVCCEAGEGPGVRRVPSHSCTPSPSAMVTRVRLVPLVLPAAVDAMMCTLYRVEGFSSWMTKELREGPTAAPGKRRGCWRSVGCVVGAPHLHGPLGLCWHGPYGTHTHPRPCLTKTWTLLMFPPKRQDSLDTSAVLLAQKMV